MRHIDMTICHRQLSLVGTIPEEVANREALPSGIGMTISPKHAGFMEHFPREMKLMMRQESGLIST